MGISSVRRRASPPAGRKGRWAAVEAHPASQGMPDSVLYASYGEEGGGAKEEEKKKKCKW